MVHNLDQSLSSLTNVYFKKWVGLLESCLMHSLLLAYFFFYFWSSKKVGCIGSVKVAEQYVGCLLLC